MTTGDVELDLRDLGAEIGKHGAENGLVANEVKAVVTVQEDLGHKAPRVSRVAQRRE